MNIQEGEGEMASQASFELEPIKEEEEPTVSNKVLPSSCLH